MPTPGLEAKWDEENKRRDELKAEDTPDKTA